MLRVGWQLPLAIALGLVAIGAIGPTVAAIPALYLAAVSPELTRIDIAQHRLPNRLVVPGIAVGLAAAAGSWLTTGAPPLVPLVAGAAFAAGLLLFALGGGMGMGDVKLACVIGLASPTVPIALGAPLFAFLVGGIAAVVVLARRGRGSRIAFGPFLLGGYTVALVVPMLLAVPRP